MLKGEVALLPCKADVGGVVAVVPADDEAAGRVAEPDTEASSVSASNSQKSVLSKRRPGCAARLVMRTSSPLAMFSG